jgi:quercetin dioxygenase-like cupin family protein
MKVIRKDEQELKDYSNPERLSGGVKRYIFPNPEGAISHHEAGIDLIRFENGGKSRLHSHPSGQILVVLEGRGFVETETERVEIGPGDVVLCAPGEKNWHGALPGESITHLAIALERSVLHE